MRGCPGTGKTTLMRGIVERLRALGRVVDAISKTHVASSRAGGCTADHYVLRHMLHGACRADYVWIEEYTQLDAAILTQLNTLTFTNVKWLLTGGPNQFPAIFSSFR